MNSALRRSLALALSAALVGGLIPPEAARAAALARLVPGGAAGTAVVGAAVVGAAAGVAATQLTLGAPALPTALAPAAPLNSAPAIAVPAIPGAADDARGPLFVPASASVPAAAAAEPAAASEAAEPAAPLPWMTRASALFKRRAAPESATASAAEAKTQAARAFDGAAPADGRAAPAPQGRLARLRTGLRRFAVRRAEAYKARRSVAHDDFGGPKQDGPMSFGARVRYGVKWGLSLVGLNALLDLILAPLMARVVWPLLLSPSTLGSFGRVELLTRFGPAGIAAALTRAPLSFLALSLPWSTAMEELTYRFLDFGLVFGLLAAAKPVAGLVAKLLDQVPDAAGFRSIVQRGALALGRLSAFYAFPVAALTSSYAFAAAHFALWGMNPALFVLNMAAGYVLARAAYKTRGLTAPFVAHLVFNFVTLGSALLYAALGLPLAASAYGAIAALVGVATLWYNWRTARGRRVLSLKGLGRGAKRLLIAALVFGSIFGAATRNFPRGVLAPTGHSPSQQAQEASAAPSQDPAAGPPAAPAANAVPAFKTDADMIASVKPSVVEIVVNEPDGQLIGSGVIVTPTGLVVTNGHVVDTKDVGEFVKVKLTDDQKLPASARIVAVNHNRDLALLQLPPLPGGKEWPHSTFAASAPREGDPVFAMGHPFRLPFSVAKGAVSGLGNRGNMFVQYLQTDAAINPGNSGGPLYNANGEIVAINTLSRGHGIGLSIAAPTVVSALQQYAAAGNIATAAIGVVVDLSSPDRPDRGVAVEFARPDSAAARAGLLPGDVIVGASGREILSGGAAAVHDLSAVLAQAKPGDSLELSVAHAGSGGTRIVTLILDARDTSEETSMAHNLDGENQP